MTPDTGLPIIPAVIDNGKYFGKIAATRESESIFITIIIGENL
jgi:hypothetical protein